MSQDPATVPNEQLDTLIDPELRAEVGDPVPVGFAATVVYAPLLAIGLLTSTLLTHAVPGPNMTPLRIVVDTAIGAGIAVLLVLLTFGLSSRVRMLREMEREFQRVLGGPSLREIIRIATLSGAAEELIFRGTIQPYLGLTATALIFGVLHFVPYRQFLPWTAFAVVIGFISGALFEWRQSIVAPLVMHVLLNFINLRLIVGGHRLKTGETPTVPME